MAPGRAEVLDASLFGVIALAWGLNYLFVREGLGLAAPLWLAFLRSGVGALGLAPFLLLRRRQVRLDRRGRRDALLLGVPNTAAFFGLWFLAASAVPPGETAVIVYTFPLWVALLSAGLLRRRLGGLLWAAVAVGFVGIALISQPWRGGVGALPTVPVAELLAAAFSWALGTVLIQYRFRPAELAEANGFQLGAGATVLLAAAVIGEPASLPALSLPLLVTVAWLGLVGTTLAYALWFHLLGHVEATRLSGYTFLVPLVALSASTLLLGERLVPVQLVGAALVLGAIYTIGRTRRGPGPSVESPQAEAPATADEPGPANAEAPPRS